MVLPLELLQQFKASDFHDPQEYEGWQERNLKLLEAGLLLHPLHPLPKRNPASQGLHQILRGASERLLDTGRNSESMQVLRSAVMSLAYGSYDGSVPERCHWADGYPLNFQLYQMLLEACFDRKEKTLIIEEVDEVIELIKKTWVVLGLNQMLHNLCFSWVLFNRFIVTGQVESNLLFSADNQLAEVPKDVKAAKDPAYAKILSTILGWAEKQLLTYHDTFHPGNICLMQGIVSLGVSAAKILAEDISREFRRRRKEVIDVARCRIDTYIRSSLRAAFAQASLLNPFHSLPQKFDASDVASSKLMTFSFNNQCYRWAHLLLIKGIQMVTLSQDGPCAIISKFDDAGYPLGLES